MISSDMMSNSEPRGCDDLRPRCLALDTRIGARSQTRQFEEDEGALAVADDAVAPPGVPRGRRHPEDRRGATAAQYCKPIQKNRDEGREQHNQNDQHSHSDCHCSSAPSRSFSCSLGALDSADPTLGDSNRLEVVSTLCEHGLGRFHIDVLGQVG